MHKFFIYKVNFIIYNNTLCENIKPKKNAKTLNLQYIIDFYLFCSRKKVENFSIYNI